MTDVYEIVVISDPLEVALEDSTELVFLDDSTELAIEGNLELLIDDDSIEILALEAAPDWVWNTKVTVSSTAPSNPRIGDLWVVRT
jgi:hypothetical protein